MKKIKNFSLIVLSIAILGLWSCSKAQSTENTVNESLSVKTNLVLLSAIDASDLIDKHSKLFEANKARLDAMGEFQIKSCQGIVFVPWDYETVHDALDAVCLGGTIFVHAGLYNEGLTAFKPWTSKTMAP
jgi:hypothetical protein